MIHRYVIALGSNMRVPRIGSPRRVILAAFEALSERKIVATALSRIIRSSPIGPSQRMYANAAAIVQTEHAPSALLAILEDIETEFGRRKRGRAWRSRPLDLDIILWSGGVWFSYDLVIPHPLFRERGFVIRPASEIAPYWRDPITGLTLRHIANRR